MVQKIEKYLHTHIHRGENGFWDNLVSKKGMIPFC